jgi:16S rRNA (guanine(1405)-N(7))-methyltransferase
VKTPDEVIDEILASRKYRELGIPPETVRDLLARELAAGHSQKEAAKAVRQKLHNIMAPYLGDPDYDAAARRFDEAKGDPAATRAVCADLLAQHASTHERLPLLEDFYATIFEVTGIPRSVLDLACALNPFALPWMGLPAGVQYHAYDIHAPRVALINHFFALQGLEPLAEVRDILVSPPDLPADAAFFFKEAHRFEQRQKGSTRQFLAALRARWLVVTLPASSLTGRHNLAEGHRRLMHNAVPGREMIERQVGEELIFIIENLL